MCENKQKIIELFYENVKGKCPDVSNCNQRHDGKNGHWLERQFGVSANGNNAADLLGFELKNQTTSKTTFGDWSANRYIYKDGDFVNLFEKNGTIAAQRQDEFCRIFGKANESKNGRFSWSGIPCPKINSFNSFGQILIVTDTLDIVAVYSYSKDLRTNKEEIVPLQLQQDNLVIAHWFGLESPTTKQKDKCLKVKLESKFNDKGWFTCKTGDDGTYQRICFGEPMTYENWIKLVQEGTVFFDSGMYQTNKRPYSQWRAENKYWESLITDCYE